MASLVTNNPFDTQQPAATNTGIVGGSMQQSAPTTGQLPSNVGTTAPATPNVATYAPTTREVNQSTGTVQGQVNSILSKDSPLMQRARTLATQQMAQRGLVNSSMSQGAGVAAMIDRATPIAAQDASAYNQAAAENTNAFNSSGQFNAGEINKFGLQATEQRFITAQNELERAFKASESDKSITAQVNLQNAQQEFQQAQNALDRTQQTSIADKNISANQALQTGQQTFQSGQNALDRTQQTSIADKNISANQALQTGQQAYQTSQSALDRAQQTSIAQAQVDANTALETARQAYQSTQNTLDRAQQESMTRLTNSLNEANVSKTFAGNLTLQTSSSINAISLDANLSPEAKKSAIQNVIDGANSTMQWGSTFYNTTLPTIAAPGASAGVVNPGAGAGGGAGGGAKPASAAEISSIYSSALGRTADAGGLAFWVNSGLSADEISAAIGRSEEAIRYGSTPR